MRVFVKYKKDTRKQINVLKSPWKRTAVTMETYCSHHGNVLQSPWKRTAVTMDTFDHSQTISGQQKLPSCFLEWPIIIKTLAPFVFFY